MERGLRVVSNRRLRRHHPLSPREKQDLRRQKKSGWEKPGPKREQWWISVVGTEKITQFPRTEDMVHPTSQEAFRGSILARMGLSEPGHLVSQKEFAKSVAMWAHEARDGEISMIEQLVHRVNAQLGTNGGQIQEQMMPVIEGTLSQIRHEKGQRPSFIFRARVLEFLKSGEIPDERALLRVAGRDEYHRSLATWLDQSDEERINKLERYLHHALEVTQKQAQKRRVLKSQRSGRWLPTPKNSLPRIGSESVAHLKKTTGFGGTTYNERTGFRYDRIRPSGYGGHTGTAR